MIVPKPHPHAHRRVVTGHDAQGRSVILRDESSPHVFISEKAGGVARTELWATQHAPAVNRGEADEAQLANRIEPTGAGSVFRVVEYPPDSVRFAKIDPDSYYQSMGATAADAKTRPHPGMHKTNTIDYAIVLSGEIYAVMDKGETLLKAGDTLIQRGTSHAWSNRTDQPCCVAFILIGAEPVLS
jgi:mannose-6-phosphate isomerase-like protein (cupin superfamily)